MEQAVAGRPVAVVTGAAQRIGATIARTLHEAGMDVVIHYRHSEQEARALQRALEQARPDSVMLLQGDLLETAQLSGMIEEVAGWRGRLDLLVNNASGFYPTPIEDANEQQWEELMGSNLKAPFFLACAAAPMLRQQRGCIINLVDIHAERPLKDYPIYAMAKAGNAMMVKSLARELGPEVRVNGVAPGAILWPEEQMNEATKAEILSRTTLKRPGTPEDIARAVLFLARDADYVSGQILAVDGGRSTQQ